MAKVQIKSEKFTSFGGIFPIIEKFDRMLSCTIDSTLGLRSKVYGYQYSEIIRSLMCVYFCGGSCVEDVTSYLMEALCLHPQIDIPKVSKMFHFHFHLWKVRFNSSNTTIRPLFKKVVSFLEKGSMLFEKSS